MSSPAWGSFPAESRWTGRYRSTKKFMRLFGKGILNKPANSGLDCELHLSLRFGPNPENQVCPLKRRIQTNPDIPFREAFPLHFHLRGDLAPILDHKSRV